MSDMANEVEDPGDDQGIGEDAEQVDSPSAPDEDARFTRGRQEADEPFIEIKSKDGPYRLTRTQAQEWYTSYLNDSKWKDKNRRESEELNTARADFEKEKEYWNTAVSSYDEFNSERIDAFNREAYNREMELNNKAWSQLQREEELNKYERKLRGLDKQQQETRRSEKERGQGYLALAASKLEKEYPDFSMEDVFNFHKEHFRQEWNDMESIGKLQINDYYNELKYHYWAMIGSQLEDKLEEVRADVVRKAKERSGLPHVGKHEPAKHKREPRTMDEAALIALESL